MLITIETIVRTVIELLKWTKGQREAIKKKTRYMVLEARLVTSRVVAKIKTNLNKLC